MPSIAVDAPGGILFTTYLDKYCPRIVLYLTARCRRASSWK